MSAHGQTQSDTIPAITFSPFVPNPDNWLPGLTLSDEHRKHLHGSGLTDQTIWEAGIKTAQPGDLANLGFDRKDGPAIVFPYPDDRPKVTFFRIRPDESGPFENRGKYRTLAGAGNKFYILPKTRAVLGDNSVPLLIAEGEKKALAAYQAGYNAIGLAGVYGWLLKDTGLLPEFDGVKWRKRDVTICFDSDVATNTDVQQALCRLTAELERRQANVQIAWLPQGPDGQKIGLDDFLVASGVDELRALVAKAKPLADAVMELIQPELTGSQLEAVVKYIYEVVSPYTAMEEQFIENIQRAMSRAGYSSPQPTTHRKGIRAAGKRLKAFIAEDSAPGTLGPQVLAERFLFTEALDKDGHQLLWLWQGTFYRYTGKQYEAISDQDLQLAITSWLKEVGERVTTSLVRDVVLNVKAECHLGPETCPPCWLAEEPERIGTVVSFKNCLLDIDAVTEGFPDTYPHTPLLFSTQSLPYDFVQWAICPTWEAFLDGIFEGDQERIALLQEWFGYHLDLNLHLEKHAIFLGDGANGKSVVLAVLRALVGSENATAIPLDRLGDRFQVAQLSGKTANIVADLEDAGLAAEGLLKTLISCEPVTGEFKNKDTFTFVPRARHTFSANRFPRFQDTSGGTWRRILLLPFDYVVPEDRRDPGLGESIIDAEMPGIFNWAILGLMKLRANKKFTSPTACDAALKSYRGQCNPVQRVRSQVGAVRRVRHVVQREWSRQGGTPSIWPRASPSGSCSQRRTSQ
ncbi:MAG: phage/plasmid primase, P4 family [Planctomycetota bacterium]|nr:phage/plasmid primase, P4 family [Planctomycetota bacterium]